MITVKDSNDGTPHAIFDLTEKISHYDGDVEAIADFFGANSLFLAPGRVHPHVYSSGNAVVFYLPSYPYDRLTPQNRDWASRVSDNILRLKPATVGGRDVKCAFGELVTTEFLSELSSFYKLSAVQESKLSQLELISGKIFKSHSWYHYYYALAQIFELMDVVFRRFRGKDLLILVAPYSSFQAPTKALNAHALRKFIEEEAQAKIAYFPPLSPRSRKINPAYKLDFAATRSTLLSLWSEHLDRPRAVIEEAIKRLELLGITRGNKDDLSALLSSLERMTPKMLDELGADLATSKSDSVVRQVQGVDRYEIDPNGLRVVPVEAIARSSDSALVATHRVALAAFDKFEKYVGNLENTHYRAFVRFADTLRTAIGEQPQSADVVMLACLKDPFARLLGAAKRDEQAACKDYPEWEPIAETTLAQLEWLSKSISDLHKTLLNSTDFEQSRLEHGVQPEDLQDNRAAIQGLVDVLQPISREAADRLAEFISLSQQISEGSSELAHAIMGSVHNLIAAMIQVVVSLQDERKTVQVRSPSDEEIPVASRPGWYAFRQRAGERLADLLFSRLGLPGVIAVSALFAWFQQAGPALSASSPTLFSGLQKAIELWMPK